MIVTIYSQHRQSYDDTDEYVAIQTWDLLSSICNHNPSICGYFMNKNLTLLCQLNIIILHSLKFF